MDEINHAAQTPKQIKSFDHVLGHRYTISDGLAGMHVEDIYQDRQGLLWIATADGGVSRFDGEHFDTFGLGEGLPHLTVMAVAEDPDGRLLFGTLGGGLAVLGPRGFEVRVLDRDGLLSDIASLDVRVIPDEQNKSRALDTGVLGQSQSMVQLLEEVGQVAETDMTVLVLGETGVGKGLLSRMIHDLSQRQEQTFIQVNCGALSTGLIESELFGHEKGAFTGAVAQKMGCFERAHGGTVFLDEIGNLPLDTQRTLLHILEEDHLTRVGGGVPVPIDVRVVAATNLNLQKAVQEGTFREDLFYRSMENGAQLACWA